MSSKANRIEKNAKEQHNMDMLALYGTLVGTIVATVGVLNNVEVEDQLKYFKKLESHPDMLPNTIKELCDFVWNNIGKTENIPLRANMVLLTDDENIRSPMVTFVTGNDETGYDVMPLGKNGFAVGLIGLARDQNKERPNIGIEWLYDTDGMDLPDEEEA